MSSEEDEKEREENSHILESHRDGLLRNVMIIDDGPDALLFLKAFLENKSYCVKTEVFSNAKEALQKFALLEAYNLVISDIRMPDRNGLQLYNSLNAIYQNLKLIL
jgi:two-component system, NtrC family, response regulator GlrR